MHRTMAAALAAALVLGIASCGGTQATLTRAQFVTKVNVACKQAREVTARQMRAGHSAVTSAPQFVAALIAGQRILNERLNGLNPPAAAKADFDAFRDDMQQRMVMYQRVKGAGGAGMQRAITSAQGMSRSLFHRLAALSYRLRLTGCP